MLRTSVAVSAVICAACVRHEPVDAVGSAALADPFHRGAWFIDPPNDEVVFVANDGALTRFAGCAWPSRVLLDSRGDAYAACRGAGQVRRLTGTPRTWDVGPEPVSLALHEATGTLYVGLATAYEVVALDLASGDIWAHLDVGAEPTALAFYSGGLAVGSSQRDTLDVYPLTLEAKPVTLGFTLPDALLAAERRLGQPLTHRLGVEQLVPAGPSLIAVVTHADTGSPVQPSYYTGPFGAPLRQELFAVGSPPRHLGTAAVPRATNVAVSNGWLLISSDGLDHVDARPLNGDTVKHDWTGPWTGPVGMLQVDDGERTFTWHESSAKRVVRIAASFNAPESTLTAFTVALPASREDAELRLGRALFHAATDTRISQQALSCDSCHRDGRSDNRTWAGQNAQRQTPMLAGRDIAHTAPYGWNGEYPTLEQYIDFTIKTRLGGVGLPQAELHALARYVREGLPGVARPAVADDETVAHGRALFESDAVGCAACHPADAAFTDGAQHDVGTLRPHEAEALREALALEQRRQALLEGTVDEDDAPARFGGPKGRGAGLHALALPVKARRFDTPSLKQAALTAPYLHDGSAETMEAVLERTAGHMGEVRQLSPRDRADLVAYLRSL